MADQVKLPGIGQVPKKPLIAVSLVAAGVLTYAWIRHSRSSATSAAAATATPAAGADQGASDIDPATGYPYGSAEDQAALTGQTAGYDEFAGGYGTDEGYDAAGYPVGSPQDLEYELEQSGLLSGSGTSSSGATATTPSEWEQLALTDMQDGGVDAATISNAEAGLPRYLAGLTLSQAQATAVQIAIGLAGEPPGGPYSIKVAPPTSTTGTGTGTTAAASKTIPRSIKSGDSADSVRSALTGAGFTFRQNPASRKAGVAYVLTSITPAPGTVVTQGKSAYWPAGTAQPFADFSIAPKK